jgi:hypothetical protein
VNTEDEVWAILEPEDVWIYDKLILSKKLGYMCGPVGIDVPKSGWYIVRPIMNLMGLGFGAEKVWIDNETDHLPIGYFWCEWFKGRHLSVDYYNKKPLLCVEGFKDPDELMYWDAWSKVDDFPALEKIISFPNILNDIPYDYINCEFIGNKLIECQLRRNLDFQWDNSDFVPIWEGENINPPENWKYVEYPDLHGRIGAFIK